MTNVKESKLDVSKRWYLGNNFKKNFKVVQPSWNKPFFLTTSKDYAEGYNDYGIYEVILKDAVTSEILDFDNDSDVAKLGWPEIVIKKIRQGEKDLNSIASGIYNIKYDPKGIYKDYLAKADKDDKIVKAINNTVKVADFFEQEIKKSNKKSAKKSNWEKEPDYKYLLQMWYDIYNAGFAGFTHVEFNYPIIALFSIDCIDKISASKI